jgi:hypothetical protein
MRFDTWKFRDLCRSSSLTAAVRELARYQSDLVGVQELGWEREDTVLAGDLLFSVEKETKTFSWDQDIF